MASDINYRIYYISNIMKYFPLSLVADWYRSLNIFEKIYVIKKMQAQCNQMQTFIATGVKRKHNGQLAEESYPRK